MTDEPKDAAASTESTSSTKTTKKTTKKKTAKKSVAKKEGSNQTNNCYFYPEKGFDYDFLVDSIGGGLFNQKNNYMLLMAMLDGI